MPSARSRTLLSGLLLALSCVPAVALAQTAPPATGLSDEAKLSRVITLYDAGKYAECGNEFAGLIGSEPRKIEDPEVL